MAEPTEAKIVFAPGPARRIAVDGDDAPQQVVNLERTGDMGSSLAMIRDGQLMLASGSANLDERQCECKKNDTRERNLSTVTFPVADKFDLEWRDCEVKFTSCAFPDRTITAHINNLTVDGDVSEMHFILKRILIFFYSSQLVPALYGGSLKTFLVIAVESACT